MQDFEIPYVCYHRHSCVSNIVLADSVVTNEDYAKRAAELGHSVLSSCEHGNQGNYRECALLAEKYGLRWRYVSEAYFVKDRHEKDNTNCHIILAAKTAKGVGDLNFALSEANISGFYYRPRMDMELLLSLDPKDVFVTTACIAGVFKYGEEEAEKLILRFAQHFRDSFMLEVQYHDTEKQRELNQFLLKLYRRHGIPLIMGTDSHFIYPEDAALRQQRLEANHIHYEDESGWYMESRADKLINYIRYWQAGGESEKTSERVRTKHRQMVEEGLWRGGTRPFGYKLIHNGRIGKKNRQLFDLAIDENEGVIVRDIFDGYIRRGMGIHRLANYLNSRYPSPDKIWAPQSVKTILTNPIYIGISRCGDVRSPVNEALRIVSDEDFEFAKRVMSMRVTRKTQTRGDIDEDNPDETKRTKTSIFGASLLSGLLYCAHCGHKLVGTYHTKKRVNGECYYRPVYRCYNGATKAKGCDGQRTYSAQKIEEAVLEIVRQYFSHFGKSVDAIWKEQQRLQIKQGSGARLKQAEMGLAKLNAPYKELREEMVKVLMGESVFDEATIKSMLDEKQEAIAKADAYLEELRVFAEDTEQKLQQLILQYRSISDWAEVFDAANNDEKKMILSRIIEKITVDKEYHLEIHFLITLDSFRREIEQLENATVSENMVAVAI